MLDSPSSSSNNTAGTINLTTLVMRVLSHWKLFLVSIILAFLVARFLNGYRQKRYNLSTTVSEKKEFNPLFSTGTSIAFNWGGYEDKIQTTKVHLGSRTHNAKVVKKLQYYINYYKQGDYRLEDAYGYIPFKIEIDTLKPLLYNTLIQVDVVSKGKVKLSGNYATKGVNQAIMYAKDSVFEIHPQANSFSKKVLVNVPTSIMNLDFTVRELKPMKVGETYYVVFKSIQNTIGQYNGIRVASLNRNASLMRLSLEGTNRKRIQDYLNASAEIYKEDKLSQKVAYAVKTKAYIDTLFYREANQLRGIEKDLGSYKQRNNIYDLSVEGGQIFAKTTELQGQELELKRSIDYLNNLESYIRTHTKFDENIPVPVSGNVADAKITGEIANLVEKSTLLERLRLSVTDNHPDVKRLREDVRISKQVLLENVSTLKASINRNIKATRRQMGNYGSKLRTLPKKEQELIKYQRNYKLTEANYNYLKQKSYEAGTAIAANVSDVKIIDKAKDLNQAQIYPNTQYNYVIALMLSLVLPLLYIVIRELFNNKVLTTHEIQNNYAIPILGVVGRNFASNNLTVFEKPKSTVAESFRSLRSNVQFLFNNKGEGTKTLVLTSSVSGEGKTMISINMATVFALSGKKTILLGMDLRKPKIFDDFGLKNKEGMVNYLIEQKELKEVIVKTQIPNLDLVLSGPVPPNPSELILGKRTDEMIAYLKENYDYIIIDTPPVGLVSDALELFKYANATMYVIRQNYTKKGMMQMIDDKYKNKEVSNIAYVLNDFVINSGYGYGYGYNYGYGNYNNEYHTNEVPKKWYEKLFGLIKPKR